MKSALECLAEATYSACFKDLPDVPYKYPKYEGEGKERTRQVVDGLRRPVPDECSLFVFPQVWSNTSIGFGGISGSAFTTAYTVCVVNNGMAAVYFGGMFAYLVKSDNMLFSKHMKEYRVNSVSDSVEYEQHNNNG